MEELFTEIEGCDVRYLRTGAGPALVLVHGLLGYSFSWRSNMAALGKSRTVYALDLPGTGYSGRPAAADCSLRGIALTVLGFMKRCQIRSSDLLASSHGGAVAMMAASLAPALGITVRSLILAAPVNPWSRHGSLVTGVLSSGLGARLFRPLAPRLQPMHGYFLKRLYGDPARIAPGTLQGYSAPLAIPGSIEYLLACVRGWQWNLEQLRRALPAIAGVPLLLIWGSRDGAVDTASAHRLGKEFHHAELAVIEGAGHLPFEECPEESNRCALDFLAKQSL